jgi:hypothetical protein
VVNYAGEMIEESRETYSTISIAVAHGKKRHAEMDIVDRSMPIPAYRPMSELMTSLNELREQGQMTWSEHEQGWIGTPGEILDALAADGFDECKREMTSSRRDCRPVGGVWQGVNPLTNSVASLIWVARQAAQPATLFIEIDGEALPSL